MAEKLKPGCTFTYSWRGKIECGFPSNDCLKKILEDQGIDLHLHHGQMVEGDCAIEASQPGYTPPEQRGDPR